jgi:hypothetical protein
MDCPASSTCPPSPTPVNAFLSLDVAAGGPTTQITVNGGAFLANEQMTLYWDPPSNKVAGGANADPSGNFTTRVKPFSGDSPGIHHLCASVPPFPCANFTLQAATPTPSPSPSPSASPSPSESPTPSSTAGPTDTASPSPAAATINGLDVIMKPPFVILPIIGGLGLLVALGYLVLSIVMRPREATLKSVAVSHLATRPDYTAGFGTPPPAPAAPAPEPSAWADVLPPTPPAANPPVTPEVEPPPSAFENPAPETPGPFGPQPGIEPPASAFENPETPGPFGPQPGTEPPEVQPPAPDEPPDLPEPSDY